MRRGFTLIELLVATSVFLFGFTAAMALFLIGTRARAQADGMLRLSLATNSIVEEIRLEAGREATGAPHRPSAYIGDGFAAVDSTVIEGTSIPEDDNSLAGRLYPYRPQPGIWYRVIDCVDEKGDNADPLATALRLDLLVVWNPVPDVELTLNELARRQRLSSNPDFTAATDQVQFIADFMAKRGFAVRETAWIIRKPSWER